ncbi:MAG: hypothetical protein B6I20_08345 [Bacteroidetes bacterium 4572_117]|nr:MAG: hypothetical protein B6I20_08345 [Bacteroidetes bacterium 4572_117]
MKKIIYLFSIMVVFSHLSFAQDDGDDDDLDFIENTVFFSDKSIHAALSPSTSALIGVHGGLLANGDGLLGGSGFIKTAGLFIAARYNNRQILNVDRLSAALGISLQLVKFAHIYVGGGYGEYKYPYNEPTILPDLEIKGAEIEGGAIFKIGPVSIIGGISVLNFEHLDFVGGIGYTF